VCGLNRCLDARIERRRSQIKVTQRDRKVNSEAIQDVLRDAGLKAVTRRNFINGVISSSVAIDKREMN
jgi:hypothetical protein